jgi:hypothetical protein
MKLGDLVVPTQRAMKQLALLNMEPWDNLGPGVVIGFDAGEVIVYWSEAFSNELEYISQLEVINADT